jgi:5-methylcytosine-specific restriction endonuclease McrA
MLEAKMMSPKLMNDEGLLSKTDALVREERELLTSILHHLREIERRRLFSALGYKSLFEMTVQRFGYSEDQAYRRLAAMRLLKELPEVEEKISSGEITLTHIGLIHSLFRQEKKQNQKAMSREAKLSVIDRISGTPVREAQRIALSLSSAPEVAKPDRVYVISENHIEMRFTASIEIQEKIERLKGLLAHQNPNMSLGEIFEKLCNLGLEQWNPGKLTKTEAKAEVSATSRKTAMQRFAAPRKRRVRSEATQTERYRCEPRLASKWEPGSTLELEPKPESMLELVSKMSSGVEPKLESMPELATKMRSALESRLELEPGPKSTSTLEPKSNGSEASLQSGGRSRDGGVLKGKISSPKRLTAEIVRTVWRRAESRCELCGSSFALEIDHKVPRAKGGSSKIENLRLTCRSCNQRAAINAFGQLTMDHYIN